MPPITFCSPAAREFCSAVAIGIDPSRLGIAYYTKIQAHVGNVAANGEPLVVCRGVEFDPLAQEPSKIEKL